MTVLTVGETMALLDPLADGQARLGMPLTLRFVVDVAERAKEQGATVVFDPNFRAALPDIPETAAERQRPVLPHVDCPNQWMAVVAREECLRHGIRRTTDRLGHVRASSQVKNSTDSVDACTSAGRDAFEDLPIDPVAGTLA